MPRIRQQVREIHCGLDWPSSPGLGSFFLSRRIPTTLPFLEDSSLPLPGNLRVRDSVPCGFLGNPSFRVCTGSHQGPCRLGEPKVSPVLIALEFLRPHLLTSCSVLSTLNFFKIEKPCPNPVFRKLTILRQENTGVSKRIINNTRQLSMTCAMGVWGGGV